MNKTVADYQEYFVLDDKTGDLFIRSDFIELRKEFKTERIWLLLSIMAFNSANPDEIEAQNHRIDLFNNGASGYLAVRHEFGKMRNALFATLIERDGYRCNYCGATENLSIDHIQPVIKGGRNVLSNLQILCRSCNSSKGSKVEDKTWDIG